MNYKRDIANIKKAIKTAYKRGDIDYATMMEERVEDLIAVRRHFGDRE